MTATGSMGIQWIGNSDSSRAAVVFVHGILSDGLAAWTHANGANWPTMIVEAPKMEGVGVCVFSYRTDAFARTYSQSDAADLLRESAKLESLWDKPCLIFVCHSLGGIVARRFLIANQQELLKRGSNIGLFLVASPSLGSADANRLHFLARMLESTQADALRFSQQNVWLNDLDKDFLNLKEASGLTIRGKELVEDEPIPITSAAGFFRKLVGLKSQVVEPSSAARYFSNWLKIPRSDHNSIAKPESREAIQHRILLRFVEETINSHPMSRQPVKPESEHAASALQKLIDRLQQGKIADYDALAAIQEALLETRSYLGRRSQGQERDSGTENLLSEVWSKAGTAISHFDSELAALCYVKGHGWADNDLWEKPGYRELPIGVDEMLQRVLDSTRKASTSARRTEGEPGTDVIEGTLSVDTLTWRTTVLLPPFAGQPNITVVRPDGRASSDPVIDGITSDKFSVLINNTNQAGEWRWRARGTLLGLDRSSGRSMQNGALFS
jgi:hypothetical protein